MVSRIKALAEALEGSDVGELDLAEGGTRIVIRRRLDAPQLAPHAASNGVVHARRGARTRALPDATTSPSAPEPTVAIVAPLTGVFYAAPSPSSAPYVQVGDTVQAGQIVCIIEAMKVFNDIKAEVSGTVTSVLARAGQLVHKGDALIRVQAV
ncbi:MAG TPA: acetyl-CoA carboxylase biotin carboxyl carrier protein [Ktedonobacterales bacterium]